MNLQGEAVHEPGQFHPLVVQSPHQFIQLLLGGDHNPHPAPTHAAQTLYRSLQIQHFLDVPGNELAHLVNHEGQAFSGAASLHEHFAPFGQHIRGDVRPVFSGLAP